MGQEGRVGDDALTRRPFFSSCQGPGASHVAPLQTGSMKTAEDVGYAISARAQEARREVLVQSEGDEVGEGVPLDLGLSVQGATGATSRPR